MKKTIICITGNIASGKDLASESVKKYFDLYIDVDKIAKRIFYNKINKIKELFKTDNRNKIAEIVFNNTQQMVKLENVIHPLLRNILINMISYSRLNKINNYDFKNKYYESNYLKENILINCALIFKLKLEFFCDFVIAIESDKENRINRLIKYRGFSNKKANSVVNMQTEIKHFSKKIDYIIENNRDKNYFIDKIENIVKKCLQL